jgi:hypothetical protein
MTSQLVATLRGARGDTARGGARARAQRLSLLLVCPGLEPTA